MSRVLSNLALAGVAALGIGAAAAPTPAEAQFFFHPYYRPFHYEFSLGRPHYFRPPVATELTPREIVAAAHRQGFRNASRPYYEDDVAVLTATSRDGRRVRLEVDILSGRIVDAVVLRGERRELAQRAPDQGAAVRRAVPEQRRDVRAAPEPLRPPTTVRREPLLPPQQSRPAPKAEPRPQPPTAQQSRPQPPAAGTREQPRRIEMTPPAALDEVRPPAPPPAGPPINSVPPAGLE
jgi:hypothetical protein